MAREAIPTWHFAICVVRRKDQFLLVQERDHDQRWYLPGGGVLPGETLAAAARREAREETGLEVRLTGVLRVQHTPTVRGARVRAIFVAEPADSTPPKSQPDRHSLGATWASIADLPSYPLRDLEVGELLRYVQAGAPVYPLSILQTEETGFETQVRNGSTRE